LGVAQAPGIQSRAAPGFIVVLDTVVLVSNFIRLKDKNDVYNSKLSFLKCRISINQKKNILKRIYDNKKVKHDSLS